jgi:nucleoside-diphosphate-sugar epimerase
MKISSDGPTDAPSGGIAPVVIGTGMMARAFAHLSTRRSVVVCASGVSNSLETDPTQFERERRVLEGARKAHPDALLLYFGTCSVYDPDRIDTPYVQHKLRMEALLAESRGSYLVLRLPLVIGPSERAKTLPSFLHARIRSGEPFEVWSRAMRYPVDVDDVVRIAARFVGEPAMINRRINVALRAYRVMDFVRIMERIVGREARVDLIDKGGTYEVSCPELQELQAELQLDRSEQYLERVLRKYFAG